MKVETLEIAGMKSVVTALRLPFKKEVRSRIGQVKPFQVRNYGDELLTYNSGQYRITVHEKDIELMKRLVVNGDEHAKAIRGLIVYAMIDAPRYFWQEMDTYRIGTDRLSSESTMHVEAKGLQGEELRKVKGELKESHYQKRAQMFSYQTLRRIYFQRRNHRLPEWRVFVDWIETLPLCAELITII